MAAEREKRAIEEHIRQAAREAGFVLCGITAAVPAPGYPRLLDWLSRGYAADMDWMDRRRDAYRHPQAVLKNVRSLIVCGMNYYDGTNVSGDVRVARYARGDRDYHEDLKQRLRAVADVVHHSRANARSRSVTDTAPLLERDFARLAGLGWYGKNTMLISPKVGSWLLLGVILTTVELAPDEPFTSDHCGTCTRCLDICPTAAFPEPGVLDSERCISYQTIENRTEQIPAELREGIGSWVFGCDLCQEVCPWNRFAPSETPGNYQASAGARAEDLEWLLKLGAEEFESVLGKTPLSRPGREGLLRNAAIAAGNVRRPEFEALLIRLLSDESNLVRGAAAWALGRYGSSGGKVALDQALLSEPEPEVRNELRAALAAAPRFEQDSNRF